MNEESVARLEGMMRDAKFSSEKVQKEFNQLNEKVQKLHHDLEEQIHTNTQLLAENSQKQVNAARASYQLCCCWRYSLPVMQYESSQLGADDAVQIK